MENFSMSPTIGAISKAIASFQGEFDGVSRNAIMQIGGSTGAGHKKPYTTIDEILQKVTPITSKFGLAVTQWVAGENVFTMISHESGEFMQSWVNYREYIAENKALAKAQTAGVVITYFKRYSLAAALGISVDEDEDGDKLADLVGTGITAGDTPLEIAIKAAFGNPIKEGDKTKNWVTLDKPYQTEETKLPAFNACTTQDGVLRWLKGIQPLRVGASNANKDAIRAKFTSLQPKTE